MIDSADYISAAVMSRAAAAILNTGCRQTPIRQIIDCRQLRQSGAARQPVLP